MRVFIQAAVCPWKIAYFLGITFPLESEKLGDVTLEVASKSNVLQV